MFGREVLGLQLTDASIQLVQLKLSGAPVVTRWVEHVLPDLVKEARGEAKTEMLGEELKKALDEAEPKRMNRRDVYLTIPEGEIFRKILSVAANLEDTDLHNAVMKEIVSYLPMELDKMHLDYQCYAHDAAGKDAMQHVAVVAVAREIVDRHLAICKAAKLDAQAIDTRPAALIRAFIPVKEKAEALIIDVQAGSAVISISAGGMVWATGLAKWTDDTDYSAMASAIADEVEHVAKFYANRTGVAAPIKQALLYGAHVDLKKPLQKLIDPKIKVAELQVSTPAGFPAQLAGVVGSALYPIFEAA